MIFLLLLIVLGMQTLQRHVKRTTLDSDFLLDVSQVLVAICLVMVVVSMATS